MVNEITDWRRVGCTRSSRELEVGDGLRGSRDVETQGQLPVRKPQRPTWALGSAGGVFAVQDTVPELHWYSRPALLSTTCTLNDPAADIRDVERALDTCGKTRKLTLDANVRSAWIPARVMSAYV